MKKTILIPIVLVALSNMVLADYGMMGPGMMGGYGYMGLVGIVYFGLAMFIFSVIFWYTYKLIIVDQAKGRKRKR